MLEVFVIIHAQVRNATVIDMDHKDKNLDRIKNTFEDASYAMRGCQNNNHEIYC